MASTTLPRVDCSVLQVQAGIHARASRSPARRLASAAPRPPAAAARARMGRRGRHQRSLGSGVRARRSHAAALGSAGAFAGAGPAPGAPCGPPGAGRPLGVGGPAQVTPRGPAAGALLAAAEQVAAGAGEPRRGPLGSRRAAPEEWPPLDALDQRIASLQGKLGLSERRPVDLEAGEAQSVIEDFLARSAPSEASSRRVPGDGRWHPGGGGWPAGR
ncbi:unnamed protein product [Prorocentrum cordatum]|uniref:Uncharacterized protein n=1 Tax=Prorocentrum cordatum TaxID=2364126 RepID=A0ABN9Y9U3_9DINO|nr:unnamed protein product [Polarella glacialis]